jgi:hypothetical protein
MPMQEVVAAVEARLASGWSYCPVRGFADDNGDTPDDASAFLVVQYPVAMSHQITIGAPGSNLFREEGAFRLVLAMPRTIEGRLLALIWTDELAKLFRAKQFGANADFMGVTTYAPTSPAIEDDTDNGNYLLLSIAVPYQADLLG